MRTDRLRKTVFLAGLPSLMLVVVLVGANLALESNCAGAADPGSSSKGVDEGLVAANNQFAFDLYAQLAKDNPRDNIFFSPLSLSAILAQTYAGARGNTAKEMKDALHFDLEADRLHPAMAALLASLEPPEGKAPYELNIANALWLEQTCRLLPEFVSLCRNHYRAAPSSVDFKNAPEAQRKTINDWVEERTRGKIIDLLPPGSVTADMRLILTNTVYFRAEWKEKFIRECTHDAPFNMAGGKSVQVPMMGQLSEFGYLEQSDLQALEMPFVGDDLGMLVLLPRKIDGLADLEMTLSAKAIRDWVRKLHVREVDLDFPRFTESLSYRLDPLLRTLGMRDAFSQQAADLSGMSSSHPLFVDAVLHKAFVDVNEVGTEATAATAGGKAAGKSDERPPVFRADHPFIFLIRDMKTGTILFLGRVMNPKA